MYMCNNVINFALKIVFILFLPQVLQSVTMAMGWEYTRTHDM